MRNASQRRAVLRALDANCNRVREGLRVAEDVARFVLDDPNLSRSLKRVRHEVTEAEKALFLVPADRFMARDITGDRGRGTPVEQERVRRSPRELLAANLKRAQEGLRSLEEFAKLLGHPSAAKFKKLRYRCYRIEEARV